jgi:hypothetical protein
MKGKSRNKANPGQDGKINREKAIKKMGVAALTASSIIFLAPKEAASESPMSPAKAPKRGR